MVLATVSYSAAIRSSASSLLSLVFVQSFLLKLRSHKKGFELAGNRPKAPNSYINHDPNNFVNNDFDFRKRGSENEFQRTLGHNKSEKDIVAIR